MGKPIRDSTGGRHPRRRRRCLAVVRRGARQGLRRNRAYRPDALALITREPDGRHRRHRAVELPLLWRPGSSAPRWPPATAWCSSRRKNRPDGAAPGRAGARGRAAARRLQRGSRLRPDAGEALALHMDVDCDRLHRLDARWASSCWSTPATRTSSACTIECGGKSPNIVFADFPDLDRAAATAAGGIFFNQGESAMRRRGFLSRNRSTTISSLERSRSRRDCSRAIRCDRPRAMGALVDEGQLSTCSAISRPGAGRRRAADGRRARASAHGRLLRRADGLRWRRQRDDHRPRGDLRAGAVGDRFETEDEACARRQRHRLRPRRRRLDAATYRRAHRCRAGCVPAPCMSTATTRTTSRCRSAATSKVGNGATSRCMRWRSTRSSRRSGSASSL